MKTFAEELFVNSFPKEILQYMKHPNLSFKQKLLILNQRLNDIYNIRADWHKCLDVYDHQLKANPNSGILTVKNCESIPKISVDIIMQWLYDEKEVQNQIRNLITEAETFNIYRKSLEKTHNKETQKLYVKQILKCLSMLGFGKPTQNPIFEYMIDKTNLSEKEIETRLQSAFTNPKISGGLGILINNFTALLTHGEMLQYDKTTIITQQHGKYYYRGENAFYGSSKSGIYRGRSKELSYIERILFTLKMNECGLFLDKFDAIKKWKRQNGDVRYGALMQHYGVKTFFIDITSDLKTALFFMCCSYENGKWRPLNNNDFSSYDSRRNVKNIHGDSRYGIIYRDKIEVENMRYALSKNEIDNEITPIGYTLMENNASYDLYLDKRFEKFKFRLTEDFCQWIFKEMDCGNKIYPNNDIPDIQKYFEKIENSKQFSKATIIASLIDKPFANNYVEIETLLKNNGYSVNENFEVIPEKKIRQINECYTIETAEKHIDANPHCQPMFIL